MILFFYRIAVYYSRFFIHFSHRCTSFFFFFIPPEKSHRSWDLAIASGSPPFQSVLQPSKHMIIRMRRSGLYRRCCEIWNPNLPMALRAAVAESRPGARYHETEGLGLGLFINLLRIDYVPVGSRLAWHPLFRSAYFFFCIASFLLLLILCTYFYPYGSKMPLFLY